jgi:hypothetical protein
MIVTILWEDQLGAEKMGFGPHEFLLSCLADRLQVERERLVKLVESHPKKGNSNVRKALQKDGRRLARSGLVFAVIDRDKVHALWSRGDRPSNCMSGISQRFRKEAEADYDLIFLIDNVESLMQAVCGALEEPFSGHKPPPDERDLLFKAISWSTPRQRQAACDTCPSFDRLVRRVANAVQNVIPK